MDNFSPVYYDFLRSFFTTEGAPNVIHIDTFASILDHLDVFLRNINYNNGYDSTYYRLGEIVGDYVFKNKTETVFTNLNKINYSKNQYYGTVSKYSTLKKNVLTNSVFDRSLTSKLKEVVKKQFSIFIYRLRKLFSKNNSDDLISVKSLSRKTISRIANRRKSKLINNIPLFNGLVRSKIKNAYSH